ncbi:basic proline-rich protein-like, partial [Cricetulus griseus]|uniref:basic proline-rich protein-like n=1 Tax=Cricetulus griseus TaxID=10029 RepID=UPI0015C4012E
MLTGLPNSLFFPNLPTFPILPSSVPALLLSVRRTRTAEPQCPLHEVTRTGIRKTGSEVTWTGEKKTESQKIRPSPLQPRLLEDGPFLVLLHPPRFNPPSRQLQSCSDRLPHPFPGSHFPSVAVPFCCEYPQAWVLEPGFWACGASGAFTPHLAAISPMRPAFSANRPHSIPRFTSAKSPPRRSSPLGSGPGDARPRQPSSRDPPPPPPELATPGPASLLRAAPPPEPPGSGPAVP